MSEIEAVKALRTGDATTFLATTGPGSDFAPASLGSHPRVRHAVQKLLEEGWVRSKRNFDICKKETWKRNEEVILRLLRDLWWRSGLSQAIFQHLFHALIHYCRDEIMICWSLSSWSYWWPSEDDQRPMSLKINSIIFRHTPIPRRAESRSLRWSFWLSIGRLETSGKIKLLKAWLGTIGTGLTHENRHKSPVILHAPINSLGKTFLKYYIECWVECTNAV